MADPHIEIPLSLQIQPLGMDLPWKDALWDWVLTDVRTFPSCCGVFLEDDVVWVIILDAKDMLLGNGLNAFIVVF